MEMLKNLRILLVEDNSQTLRFVQAVIKGMGITQTFVARDGREALKFVDEAEELIDLIICDWNMPRMTGLELLQQIRTVGVDIPFLMVTGRATIDSVAIAKKYGVSAYIAKPFSPAELEHKIVSLARRSAKPQA